MPEAEENVQQESSSTQQDSAESVLYGDHGTEENKDGSENKAENSADKESNGDKADDVKSGEYSLVKSKDSILSDEQVKEIEAIAKESGLSEEQAKKALSLQEKVVADYKSSLESEFKQKTESWLSAVKEDKEIGGDNFKQSVEFAKRAVDRFASDDLKSALDESGFGNHPELVRMLANIGKAMADDNFDAGAKSDASSQRSIEDVFYGKNN